MLDYSNCKNLSKTQNQVERTVNFYLPSPNKLPAGNLQNFLKI